MLPTVVSSDGDCPEVNVIFDKCRGYRNLQSVHLCESVKLS